MNKKYWLKAGIAGAIIGLVVALVFWWFASTSVQCVLAPIQSINLGGPSCADDGFVNIYSVMYFGIPTVIVALVGTIIGWIYGKVKGNSSVV